MESGAVASVVMSGVEKSFRTDGAVVNAVRNLNLSVARGETVALLGPNGAGKSTTIDMLLGLTPPDRGSVSLLGRPPREAVDAGLVGAMLQSGALIRDVSVRELLAMVASLYPRPLDVEEALEIVGISRIASQRTQKLSGGEAQRLRFSLALVSDPEVLVLDEPTVGLDVESRRAFWDSMRAFAARGKTVMFATHYLDEADSYADRALLMARGRVVAAGATTELRALVGRRTIRATLPHARRQHLLALPGVTGVDRRGAAILMTCADSDAAIHALLRAQPDARDIEIASAGLEEAFVQLTRDEDRIATYGPVKATR